MKKVIAIIVVMLLYAIVGYIIMGRQFDYPTPPKPTTEQWKKAKAKQKETIIITESGSAYFFNERGKNAG